MGCMCRATSRGAAFARSSDVPKLAGAGEVVHVPADMAGVGLVRAIASVDHLSLRHDLRRLVVAEALCGFCSFICRTIKNVTLRGDNHCVCSLSLSFSSAEYEQLRGVLPLGEGVAMFFGRHG
eukprot:1472041-Pyramimonas_sp.AAC.2